MAAVILAGGRGTRLGLAIPKAMMPLEGRPFLEYLILERIHAGFEPVVVCVGHLSHLVRSHFATRPWTGYPLVLVQTQVRGTGADLVEALPRIPTERFLLSNGDTVVDAPLDVLKDEAERDDRAVLLLTRRQGLPNEGAFFVDHDSAVLASLEERPERTSRRPSQYAWRGSSTGTAILSRRILRHFRGWEPMGLSLEESILPTLIARRSVRAFDNGLRYVLDFGTPERLRVLRQDAGVIRSVYSRRVTARGGRPLHQPDGQRTGRHD